FIQEALTTSDEYVEYMGYTDIQPKEKETLVYAYKVESEQGNPIGILCLCFKFDDEMDGIFQRLHTDGVILGLLDKDNKVISSNDHNLLSKGSTINTDDAGIIHHASNKYFVSIEETDGYQDFKGLGWKGVAMIPLHLAFENNRSDAYNIDPNIFQSFIASNTDISDDLKQIPLQAQHIQDALELAVWNGSIQMGSETNGSTNLAKALLWEISKTGKETESLFERSIKDLYQVILSSTLESVKFQSSLGIDIMDRNLYERANDCRWWSLTKYFREYLGEDSRDINTQKKMATILKGINELYTVYTNLIVFDKSGKAVAVSNEKEAQFVGENMDSSFVQQILQLPNSQAYHVSEFNKSRFYNNKRSYIYGSVIRSLDDNSPIGGIAIVFDSTDEFEAMLDDITHDTRTTSLFVEKKNNMVVSISQPKDESESKLFEIGDVLGNEFQKCLNLNNGEKYAGIIVYNGKLYAVGATCSSGYREYKNEPANKYINDVLCLVLRNIGKNIDIPEIKVNTTDINIENRQSSQSGETTDLACIYINNHIFAFERENVQLAIGSQKMNPVPLANEKVAGMIQHEGIPIEVIDIRTTLTSTTSPEDNTKIIILKNPDKDDSFIGFLVNSLSNNLEVNTEDIKPYNTMIENNKTLYNGVVTINSNPIPIIDITMLFQFMKQ
ncbi:MAG: chemotaxis protein CheW, partial [Patescibacteria group bacterium]|nr:chemotaxis protein CheW [Patescibacteria group bacterium]